MSRNISRNMKKLISIGFVVICVGSVSGCAKSEKEASSENASTERSVDEGVNDESSDKSDDKNQEASEDVTAERSGSIVTLGDTALEIYGGTPDGAKPYIEAINKQSKNLGEDVNVYNMLVPTHVEFGLPDKYKDMSTSQLSVMNAVYEGLNEDVKTVNVYSALKKHKNEYIYFNTDHHWTSQGAYYAYEEFAKSAGFKPLSLDSMKKNTKEDFLGTLYTQTQDNNLKNNPDKVDYYTMPGNYEVYRYEKGNQSEALKTTLYADYASGTNSYSVFLHGDFPRVDIKNADIKNKKKIVVVKGSYGNAFVPFLSPHYEEVIVIDSRHYNGSLSELVKENGVTDVLFMNNMFATNTQKIVNGINNIN